MALTINRDWFRPLEGSRTIPTRCPYCGAKVFFYTNETGSKVFFDELGPPWPIHSCPEYEARLKTTVSEVTGLVGRFVHFGDQLVHESEYADLIRAGASKRKKWRPPIVPVQPEESKIVNDWGIIREIIPEVNILKKLDIVKRTRIAAKMFGQLLDADWAQISIHVEDLAEDEIKSYTMIIQKGAFELLDLRRGCLVGFVARGKTVPFHKPLWICEGIDKP